MLGTKNVRYGGIFKASKKTLLNHTYFKDCASEKFVATILLTYVTNREPDFLFKIRFALCSMF